MEGELMDITELIRGSEEILSFMLSFIDSMALKCALELRIADIIHSHDHPITLRQIISSINSASPDIASLERIMRLLVNRKIFSANPQSDGGETLYGPTRASTWILCDSELSLAPLALLHNDERMLAPMHHLKSSVTDGADAFKMAHGVGLWELASRDTSFSKLFNDGMQSTASGTSMIISNFYNYGFDNMKGSLLDVGGGTGAVLAAIVTAHPHIKGINFDLPHVIATAPEYPGISHVGGNMFETIPSADTIFMKSLLHDWSDKDSLKILKNCRKSIPEDTGKLVLAEIVLSEDNHMFHTGLKCDLLMMAVSNGGRERNEAEWKLLLEEAGFKRINIVKLPIMLSMIEAYPN